MVNIIYVKFFLKCQIKFFEKKLSLDLKNIIAYKFYRIFLIRKIYYFRFIYFRARNSFIQAQKSIDLLFFKFNKKINIIN